MIIDFKTKTDLCGNTYHLMVDVDNKSYVRDYNMRSKGFTIQIGKRDLNKLEKELISNGFERKYRL